MPDPEASSNLSARQEHLKHLWERFRHENDLINHRLGWLWTLQGLLFASFGLMLKETGQLERFPLYVVGGFGLVSALSVGYGVWRGHKVLSGLKPAVRALAAQIEDTLKTTKPSWPVDERVPFLYPWMLLPWVMFVAWVLLLRWVHT